MKSYSSKMMNKRVRCSQCDKAMVACYCHTINRVDNELAVIILQHPSEVKHAKGTAKIAHLSLTNSQLLVGEDFTDNDEFHRLITSKKSLLLYPGEHAMSPDVFVAQTSVSNEIDLNQYQLIVIDGSWKKAHKIYCLNPLLATLDCIGINAVNESNYRIRKSSRPDSLSTLEAIHSLLSTVEGDKFQGLLRSFDAMVQFQLNAMPSDVKARY